jgi:hypothetical protein
VWGLKLGLIPVRRDAKFCAVAVCIAINWVKFEAGNGVKKGLLGERTLGVSAKDHTTTASGRLKTQKKQPILTGDQRQRNDTVCGQWAEMHTYVIVNEHAASCT